MALEALAFDTVKPRLGDNFLLLGPDAFLQDTVTNRIRETLKKDANVDLVIVYGDEMKCAQINDLLDTYSIFSSSKLILFRNADELKKNELECLAAYFNDPSAEQSIVITAEKADQRISAWKKISSNCQVVTCDFPRWGDMLKGWLDKNLAKLGKTMRPDARSIFLERVELDYASTNNELQKLALLVKDRKNITSEDVLQSLGTSRVGTQIGFARALGGRRAAEALELMERMLNSDSKGLQILGQINKIFSAIHHILLMKAAHISPSEITGKHLNELYQSQRNEYMGFANNYTLRQTQAVFDILLETDTKLKTTAASDAILLTQCILQILELT